MAADRIMQRAGGSRAPGLLLGAVLGTYLCLGTGWAEDTFQKGADSAPADATKPYVGSDGKLGGMPVADRQIEQGPHGQKVVLGAEARPLTLPQLLDEALRRNPATRQQWQLTLAAVADLGSARSAYYPTVTLDGNGNASHATTPGYQGGGNTDTLTAGPEIQIQYLLLDFGTRAAGVEAARFQLLASNYNFNAALQSTILQVEKNYYTVDGAKANVSNAEVALRLAQASAEAARVRSLVGLGTRTALLQAEQTVAQGRFNLESAKGALGTAQVALAQSLGLPADTVLYVAAPSHVPTAADLRDSIDLLIDRALRQRPDLAAKYATYKQLQATAKQADANQYPQLTAAASAERSFFHTTITGEPSSIPGTLGGNGNYNGHTDDAGVGLTFSVDLFDGFYKQNQARLARRQAEAAKSDLANTELGVIADVMSNLISFRSSLEQYRAAEALVGSSDESYQSADISYKAGLASILDLLTSQSNLASARATLAQARTTLFTASAQLANATGTLLPQALDATRTLALQTPPDTAPLPAKTP